MNRGASSALQSRRIRLLILEDEEDDAQLAVHALERAGFEVHYRRVDSPAEMRAALKGESWDAVISDYSMPQFTGVDALAILKESGLDLPFILVSGTIGEQACVSAMKNGASDYVMKSNLARLAPALSRELEEAAGRAARRASEDLRRAILASALDCIITIDSQGTIVEFNPAAETTFGFTRAEAVGQPMADLLIPPAHRELYRRGLERYLATGEGAMLSRRMERLALRKDGSQFPVELALTALRRGSEVLFAGFMRDITERKAAEAKIRALNRVYSVLSSINSLIVRERDRDVLFAEACRIAVEQGGFGMAWIGMVADASPRIEPVAWRGDPSFIGLIPLGLDPGGPEPYGLPGRAVKERKPMVSEDMTRDERIVRHLQTAARERRMCSLAVLPLVRSEKCVGVLALYASERDFFNAEEMMLLEELAGDISFALEHIEKSEKLNYLAYYDPLTGLANRELLHERMAQQIALADRDKRPFGLVVWNIDRFRAINDTLGRRIGDEVLKQVAARMQTHGPGPNHQARIGSDHFAELILEASSAEDLARHVERCLREVFGQPFRLGGKELRLSARAGIAVFPDNATDEESLFGNAEAALIKAKGGTEQYVFYSQDMNARVADKLALENRLREAAEKEQFVLYYQPKIDAISRKVVGVEALIRWRSEDGLVPPARFIPLLEETRLILQVGAWALRRAALDHRTWFERGLQAPRIAVNVSALQLRQRDFVSLMEQTIIEGIAPTGIDLEITESLLMQDMAANIAKLKALVALGVRVAIDDFGTGYSSLGYLARLPVHALKIDRSFIAAMHEDPNSMTLVSTIISLAHSLRLKVVAEGVETEEQAKFLHLLRCDEMQGYLFSKPLPFEAITEFLEGEAAPAGRSQPTQ